MMILAIITAICACVAPLIELSVTLFVASFVFWYGGIMAPNSEKYTTRNPRNFNYHGSDKDMMPSRNLFTPKSDIDKLNILIELTYEYCETKQETYCVFAGLRTKYIIQEQYHLVNILQDEMDKMLAEVDNEAIESFTH